MNLFLEYISFGGFEAIPGGYIWAAGILLVLFLGYQGAPVSLWTLAVAVLGWGMGWSPAGWVIFAIIALLLNIYPIRRNVLSYPVMRILSALGILPRISDTERIALDAGTTWIEGEYFTGKPDFKRILKEPFPELTNEEQEFLDGPVEEACRMTDDWKTHQQFDLDAEVWEYLKKHGFFGMAISKDYGGLGFSATAMNAVVAKLGSRSVALSVDVMVPNSLGPAELITHYGTDHQKQYYLPKLATGEEMPCFALTEPNAGSDASGISSSGEVFKGADGALYLKLNWDKRYITLASIATTLGLAFQLYDPDNLLGKGTHPGITCGLIPTNEPGVDVGHRHNPLGTPFVNSPTEGRDVVVPVNQIIGGPEQAGNGWRMLMETLAAGRGVFLPALNTGGIKMVARITGAYATVRQQFGLPIGKFEGIEELLAPIGGHAYLADAYSRFITGGIDQGGKPAVTSAIVKYMSSEFNRKVINNAMDLVGGAGIIKGPRNLLASAYISVPIGITVEGSNVVTRSLITFGQGLIRCHPYALKLMETIQNKDVKGFDRALWNHVGMFIRNLFRNGLLNITRGRLAGSPVGGPVKKYYRRLAWASARFGIMGDMALMGLGAELKKKEMLSGRFADILSWLFMCNAALRKFEAEGQPKEDTAVMQWIVEDGLAHIQRNFEAIASNFEVPLIGSWMRGPAAWWIRVNSLGHGPSDNLTKKVAEQMQVPGDFRDNLSRGVFASHVEGEALNTLEEAFKLAIESIPVYKRIKDAVKQNTLPKIEGRELIEKALGQQVITQEEYQLLLNTEKARDEAVKVDSFTLEELPVSLPTVEQKTDKRVDV